jgi:hypothetical protein
MAFEVTLADDSVEWVDRADSYQLEGPMTTFFDSSDRPGGMGSWSVKLASYRTERIVRIRRVEAPAGSHRIAS